MILFFTIVVYILAFYLLFLKEKERNLDVKIKRPKEILAEFYDENLEKVTTKIDGYSAKCYLHELDHLLGITMKDRVSNLRWNMAVKKSAKYKKKYLLTSLSLSMPLNVLLD